jgi:hypothetical protein
MQTNPMLWNAPPFRDLELSRGSSLSGDDYASGLARLMALDYVLVLGQVRQGGREGGAVTD